MPRRISTGPAFPASTSRASTVSSTTSAIAPALSRIRSLAYGTKRAILNATAAFTIALSGAAAAEPLTVVALGDSLTQGYGLPADQGFVPQLQAWLRAQGADVTVINAGVSGDTTAGGRSRLDWALTPETDALIVNLGGNDMLRGIDPATTRANLDAILTTANARGLPVLLVGLRAPGNYGAGFKTAFDAIYPELGARHGALVTQNFFFPLIDQSTGRLGPDVMQPDGIHPSATGVKVVVEWIGPRVLELLERVGG